MRIARVWGAGGAALMHMRRRQVDAKAAESRWCRRQEDALSSGEDGGGDAGDATAAAGP